MGQLSDKPETDITKMEGKDSLGRYPMAWVASSMQGWRTKNEDEEVACVVKQSEDNPYEFGVFGVYDGHGGDNVSKFVASKIVEILQRQARNEKGRFENNCLPNTYTTLENDWRSERDRLMTIPDSGMTEDFDPGSTAVTLVMTASRFFFANLGDSRAILVSDNKVVFATKDHKPDNPEETIRIQNADGFVAEGRVNGELGVSRSIGDFAFKQKPGWKPQDQAVSCAPKVDFLVRSEKDQFILMACDGVWDVMDNEEAKDFLLKKMQDGFTLSQCVDHLLDTCLDRGSKDNMSCVLISFENAPVELGTKPDNGMRVKRNEPPNKERIKPSFLIGLKVRLVNDVKFKVPVNALNGKRGDEVTILGLAEVDGPTDWVQVQSTATGEIGVVPFAYLDQLAPDELGSDERPRGEREYPRNKDRPPCLEYQLGRDCKFGDGCMMDHDPGKCLQWSRNAICANRDCRLRHRLEDRPKEMCPDVLNGKVCDGGCHKAHDMPRCEIFAKNEECDHSCKKIHFRPTPPVPRRSFLVGRPCACCGKSSSFFVNCAKGHFSCNSCIMKKLREDPLFYDQKYSIRCREPYCTINIEYREYEQILSWAEKNSLESGKHSLEKRHFRSAASSGISGGYKSSSPAAAAASSSDKVSIPLRDPAEKELPSTSDYIRASITEKFNRVSSFFVPSSTSTETSYRVDYLAQELQYFMKMPTKDCLNRQRNDREIFREELFTICECYLYNGNLRHCFLCDVRIPASSTTLMEAHVHQHFGNESRVGRAYISKCKNLEARKRLHRCFINASEKISGTIVQAAIRASEPLLRSFNLWPCVLLFEDICDWIDKVAGERLEESIKFDILEIEFMFQDICFKATNDQSKKMEADKKKRQIQAFLAKHNCPAPLPALSSNVV